MRFHFVALLAARTYASNDEWRKKATLIMDFRKNFRAFEETRQRCEGKLGEINADFRNKIKSEVEGKIKGNPKTLGLERFEKKAIPNAIIWKKKAYDFTPPSKMFKPNARVKILKSQGQAQAGWRGKLLIKESDRRAWTVQVDEEDTIDGSQPIVVLEENMKVLHSGIENIFGWELSGKVRKYLDDIIRKYLDDDENVEHAIFTPGIDSFDESHVKVLTDGGTVKIFMEPCRPCQGTGNSAWKKGYLCSQCGGSGFYDFDFLVDLKAKREGLKAELEGVNPLRPDAIVKAELEDLEAKLENFGVELEDSETSSQALEEEETSSDEEESEVEEEERRRRLTEDRPIHRLLREIERASAQI